MPRKIFESHARLDDPAGMTEFLRYIPNADRLDALLREKRVLSTRAYDDDAMIARFVRCNGSVVACYAVHDVTIDDSEMIAAQCELLDDWNLSSFSQAVRQALDPNPT